MTDALLRVLDRRAAAGAPGTLWLRDDDAVEPSPPLDRLLSLAADWAVPVTLAVIPAHSGAALAGRLAGAPGVSVAVHGWAHVNHAPPGEKSQELGIHRPVAETLAELGRGFARLQALHGPQFTPVLVPPWNRIALPVVAGLADLGFRALSVFGAEKPAPLRVINTHVDVIDWRGRRGGRPLPELLDEVALTLDRDRTVGVLTHHLVHDPGVWAFLEQLFTLTADHPGCRWVGLPELLALP